MEANSQRWDGISAAWDSLRDYYRDPIPYWTCGYGNKRIFTLGVTFDHPSTINSLADEYPLATVARGRSMDANSQRWDMISPSWDSLRDYYRDPIPYWTCGYGNKQRLMLGVGFEHPQQ